ncbi:MAG: hypothetical protein M1308_13595, partial [Actinobacteria bacterium]|nr:hypothetical protein [Actinomycetota bacterium]
EITDETETPEMKQLADLNSTLQSDYDNYSSQLNTFKTQSDALFNQQVDNIKATFAARKKQMDEINKSALGAQQLLGARSGRQRYTPEYQSTILSNEEAAGVSRLSDLDAQMNQALMVAQQAKTDQNWQILNKQMDLASNLYSQKRQAIIDLNTLTKERNEELRQQAQAERENNKYIQEQTDRLIGFDAYNSLTVDADGNVLVPENDELESYAIANGYNPSQYISEVKKQAQALDKMNSEERKNELDIQKAQKELAYAGLESTIAEYKQAKDLGYTTAKNISEYIQEKELAKETPTDRLLKSYDAMIKQKEATGSNLKQLPTTDIRNLSEARQLPLVTGPNKNILKHRLP